MYIWHFVHHLTVLFHVLFSSDGILLESFPTIKEITINIQITNCAVNLNNNYNIQKFSFDIFNLVHENSKSRIYS